MEKTMKNGNVLLQASNSMKILTYISDYPDKELYINDIQRSTGASRMSVYLALKEFEDAGYITANKKGKSFTYTLNYDSPVVRQFKIWKSTIKLEPLVDKLKLFCDKIILYGSAARGEDTAASDYDLAILADTLENDDIAEEINKFKSGRKISKEMFSPFSFNELKKKDATFYNEINIGITLWEKKE
jgi:predicted nucleotidyltransferase